MDGHLIRFNKDVKLCFVDIESFNLCLSLKFNRPWQIGILNVVGDSIKTSQDIIIKWPKVDGLSCSPDAARINHYSDAKVAELGIEPKDAFNALYENMLDCDYIVGHNLLGFDLYLIKDLCRMFGKDWKFAAAKILDTKCIALGVKQNIPFVEKNESIMLYQQRMNNTRAKGVKTSLITLAKEYGIPFEEHRLHEAIYDLCVNKMLWDKLKYQIEL